MEWVCVEVAENLSIADMNKNLLEKENIPVLLQSGGAAAYMGASASQKILVPEKYINKAKIILKIK
jgi:hypothetical protein